MPRLKKKTHSRQGLYIQDSPAALPHSIQQPQIQEKSIML